MGSEERTSERGEGRGVEIDLTADDLTTRGVAHLMSSNCFLFSSFLKSCYTIYEMSGAEQMMETLADPQYQETVHNLSPAEQQHMDEQMGGMGSTEAGCGVDGGERRPLAVIAAIQKVCGRLGRGPDIRFRTLESHEALDAVREAARPSTGQRGAPNRPPSAPGR